IPRRDFPKLPCRKCKLRTEHVKVTAPDGRVLFVCMRCHASRTEKEVASDFTKEEMLELSEDDRVPVGVG
ncbi:MAG TPA: hypothetical protein VFF30_03605, partial [Nitrososphaerales archaeon]|nr:hypothetical protein [Nitrososphaerales archaeon]